MIKKFLSAVLISFMTACSDDTAPRHPNYMIKSADSDLVKIEMRLEIADTARSRQIGLSHRKNLPAGTGMLFVFDFPAHWAMWMKDTFIPLDMIFLNETKTVTYIARNTVPMSENYIMPPLSFDYTRYVIELPSGTAARHDIRPGDILVEK